MHLTRPYRIALFASGSGSNAEEIINYFAGHTHISVDLILSNKRNAFVLKRAENHHINCSVKTKNDFEKNNDVLTVLEEHKIDFLILAGFLLLVPDYLVEAYPNRILNIHPSLLPKYGGKGMYGRHVHKAVMNSGDTKTGITIHYVNENYDEGAIIRQCSTSIHPEDTIEEITRKVQILEHENFSKTIEEVIELHDFQQQPVK